MSASKKTGKKNAIVGIGAALLIAVVFALWVLFLPNVKTDSDESYLYIRDNAGMQQVMDSLTANHFLSSSLSFTMSAKLFNYKTVRPGRYALHNGMNNFQLVRMLRSGRQKPLKLTFNNIRTKTQLAARLSGIVMADSLSIINTLNDSAFLAPYGFSTQTAIANFIPDTYEVFWDLDAKELFEKMNEEYRRFWTDERKAKAAAIPMTPTEVATMASIVEEETNQKDERPQVAGLYINRLKKNMPLQADPTLKFAVGDFSIRRLKLEHILFISPYNTYRNKGLPPGPIRVATKNGMDAVLDYTKHDYIFMCARETFDGYHNFAVNYAEHQANARKYQKALDARNIK